MNNNFSSLIILLKNVSNSKFPLLQKQALFTIEDCIANKKGTQLLLKELSDIDYEEALDIINKFCSLPDYTNIVYAQNAPELDLKKFFKIIIDDIFNFLLSNELDIYFTMTADLFGLFFRKGHSIVICEYLCCKFDFSHNFVVVFNKILNHMPVKYFTNVLSNLLIFIKSNVNIKYICGNISNPLLKSKLFFISQKMLFFQFYENDYVAVNLSLLVSLLSDDEQKSLLTEILSLWSDDNSIMKISFHQHFYLSKMLLLIFFNFKTEIKDAFFLGDNLALILKGIYLHFVQPTNNYRLIGMVIGEVLSKYCSFKSSDPLNFEYIDTEDTKTLKNLINIEIPETVIDNVAAENPTVERKIDSDESDFEPIVSIFDDEIIHTKRPFYVRDCFEGLSNTKPEERDYFIVCLASAADLIGRCPAASIEQSVEYCRQLLHLHIEYEVDNFTDQQKNALVALCCLDPIKVSTYLIGELFSEHNGIGVRYTILSVITRTAQSLSGFNDVLEPTGNKIAPTREITTKTNNNKRKTRYFFKRNRQSIIESRNLFNEFSNHFFYQLLIGGNPIGGNPIGGFDLFVDNIDLLSRYVYTLAIVVYCSAQCASGFGTMMKEFLLFLKSLRTHERIDIRTSVQVCFGIGLIALNGADSRSIDDSVEQLTEWHLWLTGAYEEVRYDWHTDYSSLIEKNLFLMKDLATDVANSLMSMTL